MAAAEVWQKYGFQWQMVTSYSNRCSSHQTSGKGIEPADHWDENDDRLSFLAASHEAYLDAPLWGSSDH